MSPDISIVIPEGDFNESICKAIDCCNKRGITTELINEVGKAQGIFVCYVDQYTYYYEYYLWHQFSALTYFKVSNKCDRFTFKKICVVTDTKPTEFYVGDFTLVNEFYRRIPQGKMEV